DAALVERGGAQLSRTEETLVEMTNACSTKQLPRRILGSGRDARTPFRHWRC
ncbi:MAG TPA: 4-hydroxytetrahydrobiopterin dehydratase, partial [Gemmatimonadetes bacterium]|nr:4-hydroxytetrahydrobiopterin dehydratase [Gemmatimonadota bacterium]